MARRPLDGTPVVTQSFGGSEANYAQFGLKGHHGVDYGVNTGTPIYAPEDGVIEKSANGITDKYTGRFASGETIVLVGSMEHWLMHLERRTVGEGQRVNEGQLIGYSGNTGFSTGPHLHWGTRPTKPDLNNGYRGFINPASWLFKPQTVSSAPKVISPTQRLLENSTGVNQRAEPNTQSIIVKEWPFDQEPFTFKGYVRGESINGNNIWYVGAYSNGYFWSGSFKDKDPHDLPDFTLAPNPAPVPVLELEVAPYEFKPELPSITEVDPAHRNNFQESDFPSSPEGVVLHDFGTKGKDTFGSTRNHFNSSTSEVSAHIVVSGKMKLQVVSLKHRAYHAGPKGNHLIGIEIDPVMDDETIASVREVLTDLEAHYGKKLTLHKHPEFSATDCGDDVDLSKFNIHEETPVEETPKEEATPLPPIEPTPVKPGWKTSEFYLMLGVAAALLSKYLDIDVSTAELDAVITAGAAAVGSALIVWRYIKSRSDIKRTAIEASVKK